MPTFKATTIKAEEVWKSPDGQRVLYNVYMEDEEGNPVKFKTYSNTIAVVGWEGEVITEERAGKRGPETFVKQPQKEGGYAGGSKPSYQPRDDSHIKAQWAIGQAVGVFPKIVADAPDSQADRVAYISAVENLAKEFFAMVDRVKAGPVDDNGPETMANPTDEEMDEPIDLSTVDRVFRKDG